MADSAMPLSLQRLGSWLRPGPSAVLTRALRDASGKPVGLIGATVAIPVHYATFPALAGTPAQLAAATDAQVVAQEPGETWEA